MDFTKINELKPYDLNCNIFDVYSYDGLSMQELLCQFFTKINECIKTSNETIDLAEWLVNEGLKQEVALKLTVWLNDGTLENIINVTLFENLNKKVDNVSSQLEHVTNNTIFIKNDVEDLGEFINNISGDFNKIVLLGEYNIYSPVIFSEKNNLTIAGKCRINICKDLDSLFTFDKCSNLLIDGLEIDGNNKECYKVIDLIECENSKVENCNIKNIKNLNVNKQSSIIKVLSNNFNISNIEFKNIKSSAIQENETTGKGSLQCIYVLIHEDYRKGKIENVNAYNISNIDKNNKDIVIDADVILSQYSNGGLDSNPIDSMLLIENIYGYDYGKRIVKLQTSGVNVEKIKGKYENLSDGYSLISIHNTDVNVKNAELITINKEGCSCFIDTGLLAKNINIQNIKFSGKCRTGVIQIGNGSRLNASDNIIIDNFTCNATARELISIQHTITNILFKNFNIIGKFDTDMIKINSYTLTFKVEYKLIDSKIDVVCPTLFQYTTGGDLGNVDFINSSIKVDMMGGSGNVFGLNVLDGELNIKNTNIAVNNASYMWGLFVCTSNKINIENSSITLQTQKSSDCVITRLFANIVNIYNFTTDNKRMTIRGFNTSINKCINCNRIQLEKLDGVSEQHNVSILNYSNEVYTNNNSDYNFINSDTFVLTTSVKVTNGYYSGTLALPYRMTSLKVLNCYSENLDITAIAYKGSGTSYNNIDIKCKHNDPKFNDSVNLFIIYQR